MKPALAVWTIWCLLQQPVSSLSAAQAAAAAMWTQQTLKLLLRRFGLIKTSV